MSYFLLWAVISIGGSPAMTVERFATKQQCEDQLAIIHKKFSGFGSSDYSYCSEVKL